MLNYGCVIYEIKTPDKDGKVVDINLGYDHLKGKLGDKMTSLYTCKTCMGLFYECFGTRYQSSYLNERYIQKVGQEDRTLVIQFHL